jgi:hypothetical protein
MAPILGPYAVLASRLGQFLGQVEKVAPRQITVECIGDVAHLTVAPTSTRRSPDCSAGSSRSRSTA